MIVRNDYSPKIKGLSNKNEPEFDTILSANARQYPDMFKVYKAFAKEFDISMDRFFLANGCENAVKNALLAIKPNTLLWTTPTWGMIPIFGEALGIELLTTNFCYQPSKTSLKDSFIYPYDKVYNQASDIVYINAGITPFFSFNIDIDIDKLLINHHFIMIDITYLTIAEMKAFVKKYDKVIIVGSFDKCVGCGLRCGFVIYPQELHQIMALQREQYINALACQWLLNCDFKDLQSGFKTRLEEAIVNEYPLTSLITNNFLTISGKVESSLPHRYFNIGNYDFTRFGMPHNNDEYQSLLQGLKNHIQS